MKIWSHHLVRNEERWLWYSVRSVIDYVDKVLLWDMDSDDNTPRIIEEIKKSYPDKVVTKKVNKVDPQGFTKIRKEMLDETKADWFLVVDGDEIWWQGSIQTLVSEINKTGNKYESVVVPLINVVGDIYHYQGEEAGRYELAGHKGHFALRAINRKISGLTSSKPHGTWGWTDGEGRMIQDRDHGKMLFLDTPYIHTTHLPRAGSLNKDREVIKRAKKLKAEIGKSFPPDYFYPEVFFIPRPDFVPSPWERMDGKFYIKALIETPFRKIKRRLLKGKTGY